MDCKGGWGTRGRLIWDLVARPGLEQEIWWPGRKTVGRRLEAVQERLRIKLLGARYMVGEAIRGEMGWIKLEERKEEKNMLYRWRSF